MNQKLIYKNGYFITLKEVPTLKNSNLYLLNFYVELDDGTFFELNGYVPKHYKRDINKSIKLRSNNINLEIEKLIKILNNIL